MFPNVIVPFLHLLAVLWLIVLLCGGCYFVFFFVQLLMAFYFGENAKGHCGIRLDWFMTRQWVWFLLRAFAGAQSDSERQITSTS